MKASLCALTTILPWVITQCERHWCAPWSVARETSAETGAQWHKLLPLLESLWVFVQLRKQYLYRNSTSTFSPLISVLLTGFLPCGTLHNWLVYTKQRRSSSVLERVPVQSHPGGSKHLPPVCSFSNDLWGHSEIAPPFSVWKLFNYDPLPPVCAPNPHPV